MKTLPIFFFLIFTLLCITHAAHAQEVKDTSSLWRIETSDGNEFVGVMLSRDPTQVTLRTETIGVVTIQMKNIKSIQEVSSKHLVNGQLWADNPQATRYFWGPNGFGLRKGEGYYQNVWVLFNQVSIGITNNFSAGIGIVPLFLFNGTSTPVWITPKFSIPIKKDVFNLGVGVLAGTVIGEDSGVFGIAYGTATLGNRDKNLSVGLGYGFLDGDWASTPAISISGMLRIGKRGYLLTENYFIQDVTLISVGGRTVWSKVSLDYGIVLPLSGDGFLGIPWLGLVVPIGKH